MNIIETHQLTSDNADLLSHSKKCGCFYCMKIYAPATIKEWADDGKTALCPSCGIDSVLPEHAEYQLDKKFLSEMHEHWFGNIFSKEE